MTVTEGRRLADLSVAVRESTLKRLRLVPRGSENWRPAQDSMSIADLARHLIDADNWTFEMLESKDLRRIVGRAGLVEIKQPDEFQDLIAELERTGQVRRELLASLSETALAEEIRDERFSGEVTVWWVIVRGNLDHEIHHRGQLSVYLRLLNVKT